MNSLKVLLKKFLDDEITPENMLLEAYKAGMTEAAEIALVINDGHEWPVTRAILSARDKKETL